MIVICMLLVVQTVSAFDFDNKKVFEKPPIPYGKISIINGFGFGKTIAEYTLNKNSDICGKDCYAEGIVTFYKAGKLFEGIRFEDEKGKDTLIEKLTIFIKDKKSGEWIEYDNKNIPVGETEWRIEGIKNPIESVDWIAKTNGVELTEWIYWNSWQDWNDDFEDASINSTFWTNYSGASSASGSTGSADVSEISSSDGFVRMHSQVILTGTGNSASGWAVLRTLQDYKDGRDYKINLTINGSYYDDILAIEINDGTTNGQSDTQTTDPTGTKTVYNFGSAIPTVKTDFSLRIFPNGTAILYYSNGTLLASKDISDLSIWYVQFRSSIAVNVGSGTRINNFDLFNYTSKETLSVLLNSPSNNHYNLSQNINFNCSVNGVGITLSNASLIINGAIASTNTSGILGDYLFDYGVPFGDNTWSCRGDSTTGESNTAGSRNISIGLINNSETFNLTSAETVQESFLINTTYNNTVFSSIIGNLIYNGTSYSGTKSGSGSEAIFSRSITIPTGVNNNPFYWVFNLSNSTGSAIINSQTNYQNVSLTQFAICNSTLTQRYINYTFADEGNSTKLSASIPSSSFVYWLGDGSVNKTLSFINNTANAEYNFCFTPADRTVNIDKLIQYQASGYPQRVYDPSTLSFTNATTNTTLYLLSSSDGIYVTFQVVNTAEQPLSNVFVNATRTISGSESLISSGFTGSDGSITFWLNPNFQYNFGFSRTGYDAFTTSLYPTQSSYTITLGTTAATAYDDYTRGISYTTEPSNQTLFNNTAYNFQFNLTSSYWDVTQFGFVLKNSTTNLTSNSSTSNGGSVSLNYNTGNNSEIIMNYYWIVSGNYTNGTRVWYVMTSGETEWSLGVFFTDLRNYTSQGIFGLTNFGLAIILFLFIFIFTGIMSYKFGLNSPAAISALVFSLTAFLDVGLDIMSALNPFDAVPHFPTVFLGLITFGLLMREVYR